MAKKLAGYAETSSTTDVVKGIKEEILEATQEYMARNAPRAAVAIAGGLLDPTELGIRDKLSAAKELLDRTGLVKTEKMQVEASGGVMLMPPKESSNDQINRAMETTTAYRLKRRKRVGNNTKNSKNNTFWLRGRRT